MGCGCRGVQRNEGNNGSTRPSFRPHFPRARPDRMPYDSGHLPPQDGVNLPWVGKPFFSIEELPRRPFTARFAPIFTRPGAGRSLSLLERFVSGPSGFVRPYTTGFQARGARRYWLESGQRYQPIRTVIPLHRVGPQDAKTALAYRQGAALQFPRWFTGAVDEEDLINRTRAKVRAMRARG